MTKEQECIKALQCLYLEVPSVIADDVKQKVMDALNEVKNCTIPDVSNNEVAVCPCNKLPNGYLIVKSEALLSKPQWGQTDC